jgi:hypothetical protein
MWRRLSEDSPVNGTVCTSESHAEDHSNEEHEAGSIFTLGDKVTANPMTLSFMFALIIVFTLLFEIVIHRIDHFAAKHGRHFRNIVEQTYKELMLLGAVSFALTLFKQSGGEHAPVIGSQFKEDLLEFAHMALFFLGLFYVIFILVTFLLLNNVDRIWKQSQLRGLASVEHDYLVLRRRVFRIHPVVRYLSPVYLKYAMSRYMHRLVLIRCTFLDENQHILLSTYRECVQQVHRDDKRNELLHSDHDGHASASSPHQQLPHQQQGEDDDTDRDLDEDEDAHDDESADGEQEEQFSSELQARSRPADHNHAHKDASHRQRMANQPQLTESLLQDDEVHEHRDKGDDGDVVSEEKAGPTHHNGPARQRNRANAVAMNNRILAQFDFARYLRKRMRTVLLELLRVGYPAWLFVLVVFLLNAARVAAFGQHESSDGGVVIFISVMGFGTLGISIIVYTMVRRGFAQYSAQLTAEYIKSQHRSRHLQELSIVTKPIPHCVAHSIAGWQMVKQALRTSKKTDSSSRGRSSPFWQEDQIEMGLLRADGNSESDGCLSVAQEVALAKSRDYSGPGDQYWRPERMEFKGQNEAQPHSSSQQKSPFRLNQLFLFGRPRIVIVLLQVTMLFMCLYMALFVLFTGSQIITYYEPVLAAVLFLTALAPPALYLFVVFPRMLPLFTVMQSVHDLTDKSLIFMTWKPSRRMRRFKERLEKSERGHAGVTSDRQSEMHD